MGIIQRQGIRNTAITYVGIIIGFVNLLIIQPHFLTTEEVGLTRVLFSFSMLISTFLPLGIQNITIKYFPFYKNPEARHHGFFGFMILFPLAGFILFSLVILGFRDFIISHYIVNSKLFTEYFNFVFPLTFFLSFTGVLTSYSTSLFRTSVPAFINDIAVRILSVAVVSLYFIKLVSLSQFVFLFVSVYGVQALFLLIYVFRIDKPGIMPDKIKFTREEIGGMMRFGILVSIAALSSIGLKEVSVILIGQYLPLASAGIYAIAAFIPLVIEAPLNALDKIVQPKASDAWAKNNLEEIKTIYVKSSRYLLLIGGLLFLGINLNIESLMKLLPQNYSAGIPVVFIISIGSIFNLATGMNDAIIFYSSKYVSGIYLLLIMFILAVTLNVILIPQFGLEGAAIATASASFIYNVMKYFFIRKNFSLQPFDLKTIKLVIVVVVVWFTTKLVPAATFPLADIAIRSLIITSLYSGIIYFWKIVPELEPVLINYLKKIAGR